MGLVAAKRVRRQRAWQPAPEQIALTVLERVALTAAVAASVRVGASMRAAAAPPAGSTGTT